jgi:GTPase
VSRPSSQPTRRPRERALLCGLLTPDQIEEAEGPLSEAAGLVQAAGSDVIGNPIVQRKALIDPATMLGKGKVAEIREEIQRWHPDLVVVDNDLSPAQVRNLEKAWGVRVVDRSELIMDIFARRAQTRQSRLQVELAQSEYLMPRLRRMWTHLERMEGAIGTRGPGETQLETDRRLIKSRIADLRRELREIEAKRTRQVRTRHEEFTVGLVGYTNAGKSTLLNRLTGSSELAADMLFATLDTRTRRWPLADGRQVLLSDTVGFLQRLPHHLVSSFQATLDEALSVDLLLHIVDASHPDAAVQLAVVDQVLKEHSGQGRAEVLVVNKIDRLADSTSLSQFVDSPEREVVFVSAVTGRGLAELDAIVARHLDKRCATVRMVVPFSAGSSLAALKRLGVLLAEEHDAERGSILVLRIPDRELGNLLRKAEAGVTCEILEPALVPYQPVDPLEERWQARGRHGNQNRSPE